MTETQTYDIISATVWAVLLASGPVLGVALAIGLVIAFFQALTHRHHRLGPAALQNHHFAARHGFLLGAKFHGRARPFFQNSRRPTRVI